MPNKALSGVEERSEYKSTRPCQYRRRLRQYPTELLAHPPPFRRDGRETFLAAMKIKFNCDAASPLGLARSRCWPHVGVLPGRAITPAP